MKITPILVAMAAAWLALAGFAWHIEFLAVYLILSAIVLIFLNTGSRTTGPSAYSVFNKDGERLTGTFSMGTMATMLMGRSNEDTFEGKAPKYAGVVYEGKAGPNAPRLPRPKGRIGRNDTCYCGSGLKYKKCCEKLDAKQDDDSDSESDSG